MADLGVLYDDVRRNIADYVRSLDESDLTRALPAAPAWTIRDVVSHLAGDVACVLAGDFPNEFFAAFGEPEGVVALNRWTDTHIQARRQRGLDDVLNEWEANAAPLVAMMSGSRPWADGIPPFAGNILLTDITVHQHDIYGAFGDERDRDSAAIRIANAGYIIGMGWRLAPAGVPPLRVIAGDSDRVAGDGEPAATVRASRFDMFRALSGRRNPDQIAAFEWDGDPAPYIPYFYPYGIRADALVE